MTQAGVKDMAASVKARLLNLARRTGKPYDEVLVQYALERFLFRLSISSNRQHFLLKGGLLLLACGCLNQGLREISISLLASQMRAFDGRVLQEAIIATCENRKTVIKSEAEMFSDAFPSRPEKKRQWSAFLGKGPLTGAPEDLALLLHAIRGFLCPVVQACEGKQKFTLKWSPRGPWKKCSSTPPQEAGRPGTLPSLKAWHTSGFTCLSNMRRHAGHNIRADLGRSLALRRRCASGLHGMAP